MNTHTFISSQVELNLQQQQDSWFFFKYIMEENRSKMLQDDPLGQRVTVSSSLMQQRINEQIQFSLLLTFVCYQNVLLYVKNQCDTIKTLCSSH